MSRETVTRLVFYLGLPATVGFLLGTNKAGIGAFMTWPMSVTFWITVTLVAWGVFHAGTAITSRLLRPWRPSLTIKLAAGLFVASVPARLLINAYVGLYESVLTEGRTVEQLPQVALTVPFVIEYSKNWIGVYVLWIGCNLFFDRIIGLPRYREKTLQTRVVSAAPTSESIGDAPIEDDDPATKGEVSSEMNAVAAGGGALSTDVVGSPLLSKIPKHLGAQILMIRSEDHYLRVFTKLGNTLILYRLSEAVAELEGLGYRGLRVHRSYWVGLSSVEGVVIDGRKMNLHLINGEVVPVSRTYREIVRAAGIESKKHNDGAVSAHNETNSGAS